MRCGAFPPPKTQISEAPLDPRLRTSVLHTFCILRSEFRKSKLCSLDNQNELFIFSACQIEKEVRLFIYMPILQWLVSPRYWPSRTRSRPHIGNESPVCRNKVDIPGALKQKRHHYRPWVGTSPHGVFGCPHLKEQGWNGQTGPPPHSFLNP